MIHLERILRGIGGILLAGIMVWSFIIAAIALYHYPAIVVPLVTLAVAYHIGREMEE